MQVVKVWFQICVAQWANSFKIMTGPPSIWSEPNLLVFSCTGSFSMPQLRIESDSFESHIISRGCWTVNIQLTIFF